MRALHFLWAVAVVGTLLACTRSVCGQAELLSVTSFVACVDIDRSARDKDTGQGTTGNLLDCTPTGPDTDSTGVDTDTVTVVDVRLIAGATSEAAFVVDLTTVKSASTGDTTSTSGTQCQQNKVGNTSIVAPTNCELTTAPYSIRFETTEYIYYYDLVADDTYEIPYCHVMHYYDTASKNCDKINYPDTGTDPYAKYTSSCSARVERIPYCRAVGGAHNTGGAKCAQWMELLSTDNIYKIMTGLDADGASVGVSDYYNAYSQASTLCTVNDTQRCVRTEFSSDILRKPSPPMFPEPGNGVKWDDSISLVRGEMFPSAAYTLHDLPLPSPLPLGLDESSTFESKTGDGYRTDDLQILNCVGPCAANQQNCYNTYNGTAADAQRANGTVFESEGIDIGLFALGPSCRIWTVALTPRVAVRVTAAVTDLDTNVTTTIYTDNVNIGSSATSLNKTLAMEIVTVGSLTTILGPPLGGSILVCGGEIENRLRGFVGGRTFPAFTKQDLIDPPKRQPVKANKQEFFNMRTQMAPYSELDNVLYNPWDAVLEHAAATNDASEAFFPSNRYMSYSDACCGDLDSAGKCAGDPDADDPGSVGGIDTRWCARTNVMWYYIPGRLQNIIGRGCQQIGITDMFWNVGANVGGTLASQFASDTCNSDPFVCMPGFASTGIERTVYSNTPNVSDYDKLEFGNAPVTGCMASTAFEIARQIGVMPAHFSSTATFDDYNALWKAFAQTATSSNPTGDQLGVDVTQYSLIMTSNVLQNYMPPGYDYAHPNYWLQNEDDAGPRLYYKPSTSATRNVPSATPDLNAATQSAYTPELSIELVVYLVGKFVSYDTVIPSGSIVQTECTQDPAASALSTQTVTVQNTGTIPGAYQLQVNCPPRSGLIPVISLFSFPAAGNGSTVPAGGVALPQTIEYGVDENFDPDAPGGVVACELTLFGISDLSTLDVQTTNCSHSFKYGNATEPPPTPFFGPNNPNWPNPNCGCFDFPCWKLYKGDIYGSPCFWIMTIGLAAGALGVIINIATAVFYRITYYRHLAGSQDRLNKIIADSDKEYVQAAA